METGTLIKILVFGLAGLFVLVFMLSGIHFVRAVYLHQLMQREREERRLLALQALADDRGNIALVEIRKKDGFIIIQPDGMESLALRVESEDERAVKRLAERTLAEHEAQQRLLALGQQASSFPQSSSSQGRQSMSYGAAQDERLQQSSQRPIHSSAAQTEPYICASCGLPQCSSPGSAMQYTGPSTSSPASATLSDSQIPSSESEANNSQETLHTDRGLQHRPGTQDSGEEVQTTQNNHSSSNTDRRGDEALAPSANGDVESQGSSVRWKSVQYLQSMKNWFFSTDSYFD